MSFFKTTSTVVVFICFFCFSFMHSQNGKPNILVIIADDMGIDVTNGFQINPVMPTTPTLDSLRANGLTYKNTWATPSCAPTRAAIVSGKHGIKNGVMSVPGTLDPALHTSVFNSISTTTNDAYAKAVIGKWHIADRNDFTHPQQHGVDHYEGLFNGVINNYFSWEKLSNGANITVNEYLTSHITNSAINWLDNQNQDEPWFLWLAHTAPHIPFHVPPADLFSIDDTSTDLNKYIAAIEAMDHEIGRLLYNIDEETKKNTIVIFIGDNGTPGQVSPFFDRTHSKGSLYEGGIRVPMIVSGKGVSRINEEEEGLTHVLDLYATILELGGTQLKGGINNSLSLKPSFSCADQINRTYNYTDYRDRNDGLEWAIRTNQYKLIENESGNQEFYDITIDIEEENNLIGSLTPEQQTILTELETEANTIRTGWSCNDGISNGDEVNIDDCDIVCDNDNIIATQNIGCCAVPEKPNAYFEYIKNNERNIYSNGFPNHDYCFATPQQMPEQMYHLFKVDETPEISGTITNITNDIGRPVRYFGVAKNGVIFDPTQEEPYVFENPNTGEYNWDWVLEGTNNQGIGPKLIELDCSSGQTGPQGYHYHGNMFEYLETVEPGISSTTEVPNAPTHIGWASDGYPIVYRFGPDKDGTMKELAPSFQLLPGERPGDGITAPCGSYNGKYTNDFEYICGKGDLDQCNGIERDISITTPEGIKTFNYFYVITADFPQISRCMVGNVSSDFDNNNPPLEGEDNDNDGFIEAYDCDDSNANSNPALNGQIPDLGNCEILSTTNYNFNGYNYYIGPNPSNGSLEIASLENEIFEVKIYDINAKLIHHKTVENKLNINQLSSGLYIVKVTGGNNKKMTRKIIVN